MKTKIGRFKKIYIFLSVCEIDLNLSGQHGDYIFLFIRASIALHIGYGLYHYRALIGSFKNRFEIEMS